MSFKWFDWCSWFVGYGLVMFVYIYGNALVWPWLGQGQFSLGVSFGGVFCVDYVGFCLSVLSAFVGLSLWFWGFDLNRFSLGMVVLSIVSSVLCYCCIHGLWFWLFYEMTIFPLLLVLWSDSPYSERYVALWYFSGYIVLGSLPILLGILYFSNEAGSFDFRVWSFDSDDWLVWGVRLMLGLMFISKIPLLPFHVWLPIVHAESSSPVSVCLSGYVMKLGLLGVYRFCWDLVPSGIFGGGYIIICLLASIGFFISALRELDAKRWLALVSLGHIAMTITCFSFGDNWTSGLGFLYGLGHGLSAGGMFLYIWVVSRAAGTRNWMVMKRVLWGSLSFRVTYGFVLCAVSCIPPTTQFFSELFAVMDGFWVSNVVLAVLLYIYLFLGSLVPSVFFSCVITRQYDVDHRFDILLLILSSVIFLVYWGYILFTVC